MMRDAARRSTATTPGCRPSSALPRRRSTRFRRRRTRLPRGDPARPRCAPRPISSSACCWKPSTAPTTLAALAEEAERAGLGADRASSKAWALRRQGRFDEALAAGRGDARDDQPCPPRPVARRDSTTGSAGRAEAFAAFEAMNRASDAAAPRAAGADLSRGRRRRRGAARRRNGSRPGRRFEVAADAAGAGLHPRLSALGHDPARHLADEHARACTCSRNMPVLRRGRGGDRWPRRRSRPAELGGGARRCGPIISKCSTTFAAGPPGQTVVDKHPLHMARMPLIHRSSPTPGSSSSSAIPATRC